MAKKKVVKDALVEEEKVKKAKKEEVVEEVKATKEEPKKEVKKAEKKEKVKKEKTKKEKKDGFFRKTYKEMKKVSWPSIGEVFKYSFAVLVFCLIFIGFFKLVELFSTFLKWVMS